jgi:hypothetical protein
MSLGTETPSETQVAGEPEINAEVPEKLVRVGIGFDFPTQDERVVAATRLFAKILTCPYGDAGFIGRVLSDQAGHLNFDVGDPGNPRPSQQEVLRRLRGMGIITREMIDVWDGSDIFPVPLPRLLIGASTRNLHPRETTIR